MAKPEPKKSEDLDDLMAPKPKVEPKPEIKPEEPKAAAEVPKSSITKPDAKGKIPRRLPHNRIRPAGYLHNTFDVTVESGVEFEQLLQPDYWTHVAAQVQPHDTIIAQAEDGAWYARLFVVNADRLWLKVHVLEHHDLARAMEGMPKMIEDDYEIKWLSALSKFAVIRKADRQLLKDQFNTRLDAYQWLDGYIKAMYDNK